MSARERNSNHTLLERMEERLRARDIIGRSRISPPPLQERVVELRFPCTHDSLLRLWIRYCESCF